METLRKDGYSSPISHHFIGEETQVKRLNKLYLLNHFCAFFLFLTYTPLFLHCAEWDYKYK